jgi:hypothetical protein
MLLASTRGLQKSINAEVELPILEEEVQRKYETRCGELRAAEGTRLESGNPLAMPSSSPRPSGESNQD